MNFLKKQNSCYACEAQATSREHIPPVNIFEKPRPNNLITVPSCDLHNMKKSGDDEYFRLFIATSCTKDINAENLIKTSIARQFKRKPSLLFDFLGKARRFELFTKGGIFLGSKPGFIVDRSRIQKVLNLICKGLFYKDFSKKVPADYVFRDFIIYPRINNGLKSLIKSLEEKRSGDGRIFKYKCVACQEDENIILWFLVFFKKFLVMCLTKKLDNNISV